VRARGGGITGQDGRGVEGGLAICGEVVEVEEADGEWCAGNGARLGLGWTRERDTKAGSWSQPVLIIPFIASIRNTKLA